MSQQDFGSEYDESCTNCGDPLIGEQNWSVKDIRLNLQYCSKPECQQAKPMIIKNTNGKSQKKRVVDKGLKQELKERSRFIKLIPDQQKVQEFTRLLADPRMRNGKGDPRYSKIFKTYGINESVKGFTIPEMAVPQFPNEVDINGCPSTASVAAVKRYLKSLTKRFRGNLEIYSTRTANPNPPHRREWRWHTLKNKEDLDRQVFDMREIAKNIELSAKERETNFDKTTYDQRMEKVDLLDQFFDK